MNVIEVIFGQAKKLDEVLNNHKLVLKMLTAILGGVNEIKANLALHDAKMQQVVDGTTPWQLDVTARLQRIEDDVSSEQAARLIIVVGKPEEQQL